MGLDILVFAFFHALGDIWIGFVGYIQETEWSPAQNNKA
jgi:hypothetical protein